MKKNLAALLASVLFLSPTCAIADDPPLVVSLVHLLIGPERYVGHRVQVMGYLDSTASDLYLTSEHAAAKDYRSSIAISDTDEREISESQCRSSFVQVTGTLLKFEPNDYIITRVTHIGQGPMGADACWSEETH